jgi:Lar family restriction alleviation protein
MICSMELKPCPFCGCKSVEFATCSDDSCCVACDECSSTGPVEELGEAAMAAWNNRAGWISVDEQLPPDGKYIYSDKRGNTGAAMYYAEKGEWEDRGLIPDVTHWQPLPEPPND